MNYCRILDHLGSGQFGTVDKGIWRQQTSAIEVAVKSLRGTATEEEEIKIPSRGLAINGQFHHKNVVKLYGVVTIGYPVSMNQSDNPHTEFTNFLLLL